MNNNYRKALPAFMLVVALIVFHTSAQQSSSDQAINISEQATGSPYTPGSYHGNEAF